MSDRNSLPVGPVAPVGDSPAVLPVRPEREALPADPKPAPQRRADVAAATGGNLPAAYAQFVINPDTHDVVIRIKDSATNQVISEYPSREVEDMAKYMKQYADVLARHRSAPRSGQTN